MQAAQRRKHPATRQYGSREWKLQLRFICIPLYGFPMRLLLLDGHYYLYRSFFAIRGLTNSKGDPTNAIYGFCKAFRKMLADVKPDRVAVIWDKGLPLRRTELQPAYKQNRTEMPETLRPQEIWLQKNIGLFGPPSLSAPNTEADDLIASYAVAARADGAEVVIATNDKDIMQLVDDRVSIYATLKATPGQPSFALLGPAEVEKRWGVPASRIGEVLALTGDASDNIPGVPGIGEKTAAKLVCEYGTVGEILANLDKVRPEKVRDKLAAAQDLIIANRQMVALDLDLPLPMPWEDLVLRPDYPPLIEALRLCEFKGLLAEVEAEAAKGSAAVQSDLFLS